MPFGGTLPRSSSLKLYPPTHWLLVRRTLEGCRQRVYLPRATMPLERWPTPSCSLLRGAVGCALLKTDLLDFSMLSTTKF